MKLSISSVLHPHAPLYPPGMKFLLHHSEGSVTISWSNSESSALKSRGLSRELPDDSPEALTGRMAAVAMTAAEESDKIKSPAASTWLAANGLPGVASPFWAAGTASRPETLCPELYPSVWRRTVHLVRMMIEVMMIMMMTASE